MATLLGTVVLLVVALLLGLQVFVRVRAHAMRGKSVRDLPGPTGSRLAAARRALVYFFSPTCAACKVLTPRFTQLSRTRKDVFVVDVFQDFELARALSVMGTPSVVEIENGTIVGYHVGAVPPDVLARFG